MVKDFGLQLTSILTTHHHNDHCGGNSQMLSHFPGIKVFGGDERVQAITDLVKDGDELELFDTKIKVFHVPCHTSDHVLYYVQNQKSSPFLFTGDTLFVGGCGRFFEGTAEQMHTALNKIVASLPHDTQVYCGHEYTVQNLKFAHHIEPDNEDVKQKLDWAVQQISEGKHTIPSTIGDELKYNPFMRVHVPSVQQKVNETDEIATMLALRELKNKFKWTMLLIHM